MAETKAQARPVVVIHPGLGVSMTTFAMVISLLERRHVRVIRWPRHGVDGAPSRPAGTFPTPADDAKTLHAYMHKNHPDVRDVVLVGHSMAGPVIEAYARFYPEHIRGLLFLDATIPDSAQNGASKIRMAARRGVDRMWGLRPALDTFGGFFRHPKRLSNLLVENAAYPWYKRQVALLRGRTRLRDMPVIVVAAALERHLFSGWISRTRAYTELLRNDGAPRARFELICPSGHNVQKHHPHRVAELILEILDGVDEEAAEA